jgi:hypothetical protein
MKVSGALASLNPTNNSGGSFGGAIGYRGLIADNSSLVLN